MSKNTYRCVLEAYLKNKEATGEPLPGIRGRVIYRRIAIETGIPYTQFAPGSEVRLLVDASLDKLTVSTDPPRPRQYRRTQPAIVGKSLVTYGDLKDRGRVWLRQNGYSEASIASYLSGLNAYMKYFTRNNNDPAAGEFGTNFAVQLQAFLKATGREKVVASMLRLWSTIYCDLQQSNLLPSTFAEALTKIVNESGRTKADIARSAGLKFASTLWGWMAGDFMPTDPAKVAKLEEVLAVLPGTLSLKLTFHRARRVTNIPIEWWPERWQKSFRSYGHQRDKVIALIPPSSLSGSLEDLKPIFDKALQKSLNGEGELPYRQKLMKLRVKQYRLRYKNWPDSLKSEFLELKEYKTAPSGLRNKKRRGRWVETTANIAQTQLESFFGFLCQPIDHDDPELRGLGLGSERLTLAWLAVQDVVEKYLEFSFVRSCSYSTGTETFVGTWIALLQPESGWLWLHAELLDRLPKQQRQLVDAAGGWENHCVNVCSELRDSITSLKRNGQLERTREPMAPIGPILDHHEPLSLINNALLQNKRDLYNRERPNEIFSPQLAAAWRDHFLISFLSCLPLRAKHWGLLTYKEDGSGYLQKHSDGWWLVIPYDDFKNVRNTKIFTPHRRERILTLRFSELEPLGRLVPLLERYLELARPIIVGEGSFLFPTREGKPLTSPLVYLHVKAWTQQYLSQYSSRKLGIKGVFPFGPHAFRDIVATHIIKTTGLIALAANILLDSEELVLKHYARFLPEDRLKLAMAELTGVYKNDEEED